MSFKYGIPVSALKQGETPIYRNPEVSHKELLRSTFPDVITMQDYFLYRVQKQPSLNLIGKRDPTKSNQQVYKTSAEIYEIAKSLGSAIIGKGMGTSITEYLNYEVKLIGIYSKNRMEWAICDFASMLYGFTTVPLQETLGAKGIEQIFKQTNLETIFCSKESIGMFSKEINLQKIKNVISFDEIDSSLKETLLKKGLKLYNFYSLIAECNEKIIEFPKNISINDIYSLMYTSGTSGDPKGVIITHEGMIASFSSNSSIGIKIDSTFKQLSQMPLGHMYERTLFHWHCLHGATIGFYSGDITKIVDDIKELKPTIFGSVPRLLNRFQDNIKKFKDDPDLIKKARELFGGEIQLVLSSAAPISSEVLIFLKKALGVNVLEAYGQTEAPGIITVTSNFDFEGCGVGTIGGPTVTQEIKLVDIPEMNYTSECKENGIAMPKGELLVRRAKTTPGYQKNIDKSKETFDNEGWLQTGDVAALLPNGALKLIDRKKNVFKLSNGENIAPEKLELIYIRCSAIDEIFIDGDSFQNQIVAIALPNKEWVIKKAKQLKIEEKMMFEDLIQKKEIKLCVLEELAIHAKKEDLIKFEQIKNIHLISQSFQAFDLITTTFKLKRFAAKEHFKQYLVNMYKEPLPFTGSQEQS